MPPPGSRACFDSVFLHKSWVMSVDAVIEVNFLKCRPSPVMPVSALRAVPSVVAEVRPSPNHNERRGNRTRYDPAALHRCRGQQKRDQSSLQSDHEVSAHYVVLQDGVHPAAGRGVPARLACRCVLGRGETDINSCSIGIEIANPGHEHGCSGLQAPDRGGDSALPQHLHPPRVPPHRVLAEDSDVAPARKRDRARSFRGRCWPAPASACGSSLPPSARVRAVFPPRETNPAIEETQTLLAKFGYDVPAADISTALRATPSLRFNAISGRRVDGIVDSLHPGDAEGLVAEYDARLTAPPTG